MRVVNNVFGKEAMVDFSCVKYDDKTCRKNTQCCAVCSELSDCADISLACAHVRHQLVHERKGYAEITVCSVLQEDSAENLRKELQEWVRSIGAE